MNDRTPKFAAVGLLGVAALAALCVVLFLFTLAARFSRGDVVSESSVDWAPTVERVAPEPESAALADIPLPRLSRTPDAELAESPPTATPGAASIVVTGWITHVVQSGENLYRISLAYGLTVSEIMAANQLVSPDLITAGQLLRIPVTPTAVNPAAAGPAADESLAAPFSEPATPTSTATATPLPRIGVNGLALESIMVMPDAVRQNVRQIYERGEKLGRNAHAYSKLGDSTIEAPHFMSRFDEGPYVLGDFAYLQEAVDYFAGSHGRQGVGVRRGFHSWTVTDPLWADKTLCLPNENSVACEIRLHNPSIMLIRLGSNDAGVPAGFEQSMRQVLDIVIESGVIPVLATKADRFEGSNVNNEIIRRLAGEYQLPLWDFDLVASTIPGRGLDVDGVHLTTFYAHDYTSPVAFQRGHSMHNLTALMALDVILREVIRNSE